MRTKYDYFLKHNTYIQTYKFGMFKIYSPVYWWWTGSFSQSEVLSYLYLPSSFKLFLSLFLLVIQLAKESVSDQIGMITRSQEDKERYKLKDKEVRHACEEDKKDYLEGICLHLQDRKHTSQAGIAYNYIRVLKKPFTTAKHLMTKVTTAETPTNPITLQSMIHVLDHLLGVTRHILSMSGNIAEFQCVVSVASLYLITRYHT